MKSKFLSLPARALLAIALTVLSTAILAQSHATVLMYHHVATDTPPATSETPARFREQMDYLSKKGFNVLPLTEIVRRLQSGEALPERAIAISFDDGYRSVCNEAYPLLKARGWPFTVFVNTEALDRKLRPYCSWEQLREMRQHGVTIANHSVTHAHMGNKLPGESAEAWEKRVREEISIASARIKAETGDDNKLFAYPFGEYSGELKTIVAEIGLIGFGQHSGPIGKNSDFLALPRFALALDYGTPANFALRVNAEPFPSTVIEAPDIPLPYDHDRPELRLVMPASYPQGGKLQCYGTGQGAIPINAADSAHTLNVKSTVAIPVGRSRYNCTQPTGKGNYYWYTQPWFRLQKDGYWREY